MLYILSNVEKQWLLWHWHGEAVVLKYNGYMGPRGGKREKRKAKMNQKMRPKVLMAYVRKCEWMKARPGGVWGSVYSVPRVGVLGWFRPMVRHSHPAKSTSSTSDRLMNVWLISIFRSALSAGFLIKHFVTKSWKSLVNTPCGSLGGGSFTM